jgi:glutathione S-transferase
VWTAFNPLLSAWSGLVPLAFFVLFVVNIYMAFGVGAARRKYGIKYPQMYAVPGTPRNYGPNETKALADASSNTQPLSELCSAEDAYAYNSVQRGHQNSIENYPLIIGLTLVSWGFPIPSGFALLSWSLGRIFYFEGYKANVEKRNQLPAALLTYPALLTLWGLALTTAVHLFQKTAPYNYS